MNRTNEMTFIEPAIVEEACQVANRHVQDIEMAAEIQRTLINHGSRFICRCTGCKALLRRTESWLASIELLPGPQDENIGNGSRAAEAVKAAS